MLGGEKLLQRIQREFLRRGIDLTDLLDQAAGLDRAELV